jgi:uncharacterized protein
MMPSIEPGTALITGASSGIGAVYAERLARRGHDLILVARSAGPLEALATRLRQESGRGVEVVPADLSRRTDVERIEQRLRNDPHIAMLVNNAGIAVAGPAHLADVAKLDAMVQLNITAAMRLAVAATAGFVARGAGTLINVASVLALMPERFNGVYAGSKAFVLTLTQSIASDVKDTPIRVQAVLPGATRTAIWDRAGIDPNSLPPEILMETGDMVDAALAGLDDGEQVTIPSLPDPAEWERLTAARFALFPNLSRRQPAVRYGVGGA